jgi:2-polyprenyl-3-methyl-5-hydroxy-6-metoxy-1,4-benzoquinol methylase
MLTSVQYELLRRIRPTDPPYLAASAYEGRSKLDALFGHVIGDISGQTVVDFGCGDGLEAVDLARRGAKKVYGIDTNAACLEMARWQANHAGVAHAIELSGEAPAGLSADLAISVDSFEHYSDPAAILRLLYGLLRPGGVLLGHAALREVRLLRFCARRDAARSAEHLAAFGFERGHAGAADALGGARDEHAFALKMEVHSQRV